MPRMHGACGIIFMRERKAEVEQHTITEILREVAIVTGDDRAAGRVVGAQHCFQRFRIEFGGQGCRSHQIAEHDRELAVLAKGTRTRQTR